MPLNAFLIGLWACLCFVTEAYLQSTYVQPIFRCNRILHAATLLRCQNGAVAPEESDDITSSDDHDASRRYMQRVAVLLPSSFDTDPDGDGTNNWQHVEEEASKHLQQIATQSKLSVLSHKDLRSNDVSSYTHILTAVPCPNTGTYAIAIHANPPTLSKKRPREKNKQTKLKLDPFFVDLCPASDTRLGYRMNLNSNKSAGSGNELLLKALGIKKMLSSSENNEQQQLVIYDLTAGLARDSMIMLSSVAGNTEKSSIPPIKVHMVERDPLVASLLLDAMRRLDILDSKGSNIAKFISKCLSMEEGDALSVLQRLSDANDTSDMNLVPYPPDIVYLDPMFPPRKKKASAVKKDMAMLHSLLETATMSAEKEEHEESEKARLIEEQQLLEAACHAATRRVVVKRPANALPLGLMGNNESDMNVNIPTPSFDVRGNINRWDVYC